MPSSRAVATLLVLAIVSSGFAAQSSVVAGVPEAQGTAAANVTVENITVSTAPREVGERLTSRSAIQTARNEGNLTRDGTVVPTDTLVLTLEMSGLDGRLAAASGDNATARFFDVTYGNDSAISLQQVNPPPQLRRKVVRPDRFEGTTVVSDPANDTYHLVTNLSQARVGRDAGRDVDWDPRFKTTIREGDIYAATVSFGGERLVTDDEGVTVRIVEREAVFGGAGELRHLSLPPSPNATVRGLVSLAPGTPVTIRIENRSDAGPPLERRTRVVERRDEQRQWDAPPAHELIAMLNATELSVGTSFDAVLAVGDETLARTNGSVGTGEASVDLPATASWDDDRILVRKAELSDGGFLVAQVGDRQPLAYPDDLLHVGHVAVDSGIELDLSIPVSNDRLHRSSSPLLESVTVVAVTDANDNGRYDAADVPYVRNGSKVADVADVRSGRDDTGTETHRPNGTVTPSEERTNTPTASRNGTMSVIEGATNTPPDSDAPTDRNLSPVPTSSLSSLSETRAAPQGANDGAVSLDGFGVVVALVTILSVPILIRRGR